MKLMTGGREACFLSVFCAPTWDPFLYRPQLTPTLIGHLSCIQCLPSAFPWHTHEREAMTSHSQYPDHSIRNPGSDRRHTGEERPNKLVRSLLAVLLGWVRIPRSCAHPQRTGLAAAATLRRTRHSSLEQVIRNADLNLDTNSALMKAGNAADGRSTLILP